MMFGKHEIYIDARNPRVLVVGSEHTPTDPTSKCIHIGEGTDLRIYVVVKQRTKWIHRIDSIFHLAMVEAQRTGISVGNVRDVFTQNKESKPKAVDNRQKRLF